MSHSTDTEGEGRHEADLQEVRRAFTAVQQGLRCLQEYPPELLNLASFPYRDSEGHANIDKALELLNYEVTQIAVRLANYRASRSRTERSDV